MKNIQRFSTLFLLGLLLLAGASAAQTADLSRYVALGDSLGAGFMSGGLVDAVQAHSYPVLIYQQSHDTADGFALPTVSPPGLPPVLQLTSLSPLQIVPAAGVGQPTNALYPGLYGNLCVPGADINDILNTRTGGLHDLVLRGLGTQLELAAAQHPTFATLWVNNDALGAALSGVVIDGVTLTPAAEFEAKFRAVAQTLSGLGADLAFGTVVNPVSIPYVTTIPPILIDPTTNEPVLINGAPVPLIGPDGPLTLGQDFLLLLQAKTELAMGRGLPPQLGGTGPLSDGAVLSAAEAGAIIARVGEYNAAIRTIAGEVGAAVFDANAFVSDVAAHGLVVGGLDYSTDFITGGMFSLDGVHGTPFGYAVIANEWIKTINAHYGTDIPLVRLAPYIFGPYAGAGTGYPVTGPAHDIVSTKKAERQLRKALGIPSAAKLARIKARLAGDP